MSWVWGLEAYDSSGEVIYQQDVFIDISDPLFLVTVDIPAEAVSYCLLDGFYENKIHCVNSAALQSVQITRPQPGQAVGSVLDVAWEVQASRESSDAKVTHSLFYRTGSELSWQLATMTDDTELSSPSFILPDTDSLSLKIVSSDGVNSVEHIVEGLTVSSQRPPYVTIVHPQDGAQSDKTALWGLEASVVGFGDQSVLPGNWSSSLDGALGSGSRLSTQLSVGTHVIRYEANDSEGLTGSSQVTVTVYEVMDHVDLGLEASDLALQNQLVDPACYAPAVVAKGKTNTLALRVQNQGTETSARVRMFLRGPAGAEVLLEEKAITLEPFEVRLLSFTFNPLDEGAYTARAVIDQVQPEDPDDSNNQREWVLHTPQAGSSELYVYKDDTTCGGKTPCYDSIQKAVNAAVDGAVIRVAEGTYPESPSRGSAGRITLSGGWNSGFTSQTGTTEIYAPSTEEGGSVNLQPNIRVISR